MRFRNVFILLSLLCFSMQVSAGRQREATATVVNPALSSPLRATISLDGFWDFATDPKSEGEEQKWFMPAKSLPNKVSIRVPGCWEAQGIGGPGNSTAVTPERSICPLRGSYVGTAWYKKKVAIPKDWTDKQVWLKVGGVHSQGWFWVNGTYVAHVANYCGTYKYNITDLVRPGETAVIAVKVRNDVASGKGLFGWIHRFGGLYRSVEVEATPYILIDNAYVDGLFDEKNATVHVRLRSTKAAPQAATVCGVEVAVSTLDGKKAGKATGKISLSGNETKDIAIKVLLDPFNPWSPEQPNLYRANIVLKDNGKNIDGWVERFGVRKLEVRGGNFYLNNQKYFVRGYGDDFVYPITLCSPASRKEHKKHLQLAKDYGFTYVRHHTHCELPEFYEAADEVGIMVQPEMPYYGARPSANADGYFKPKEDLVELITHYRRYVSLSTYCTGNEGHLGAPIDNELYQLAKQMDPTRLFLHQDGGHNTPENSDFSTGPVRPWEPGTFKSSRAYFAHEYLNLATDEDPRLAKKYSQALRPPVPAAPFKKKLEEVGLSWKWAVACLDAGNELQRIYQKRGLESARLDPECDGYIYWTIVDVGSPAAQGLFNQFWEPKASTAEFFQGFNSPTVVLAKLSPGEHILSEGDELKVEWWISHFDRSPVKEKTLSWKLVAGRKTLKSGKISGISAEAGEVKLVATTTIKVPSLTKAVKAKLIAKLDRTNVKNSWELWLFPKIRPKAGAGEGICASERIYSVLADRYPGMTKLRSPKALNAKVVLTDFLDGDVLNALDHGKSVLLLKLIGPNPGVGLGWWVKSAQTGTAVARHPAFGSFPHDGYLSELFFRIVQNTIKLSEGGFNSVEPLMVGHGSQGYLLYVFQAKAGSGKILASGLNLLSDNPESVYLLNEFIRYVKSDRFKPKGVLDVSKVKPKWKETATLMGNLNGWSQTIRTAQRAESYSSFLGPLNMSIARQTDGKSMVVWKTKPVSKDIDMSKDYTFKWIAGTGWMTEPAGKFTLMLADMQLVDFHVTQKSTTWKSPDGAVNLRYVVMGAPGVDSSGVMELTLPASLLEPGEKAELCVVGSKTASQRWFGVYELQ